jgi:hypothetical protein
MHGVIRVMKAMRDGILLAAMAALACVLAVGAFAGTAQAGRKAVDLKKLHGRVQFVDSFPDYKVQVVNSFPDLKVQMVDAFPDKPGQWQKVDSFPDFRVQIVESFPDFTIQWVDSFPGPAR